MELGRSVDALVEIFSEEEEEGGGIGNEGSSEDVEQVLSVTKGRCKSEEVGEGH